MMAQTLEDSAPEDLIAAPPSPSLVINAAPHLSLRVCRFLLPMFESQKETAIDEETRLADLDRVIQALHDRLRVVESSGDSVAANGPNSNQQPTDITSQTREQRLRATGEMVSDLILKRRAARERHST